MLENIFARIIGFLYWVGNFTLNSTLRFKTVNAEILDKIQEQGKQAIFASWHGQFFPASYYYRNRKMLMIPIETLRGKILRVGAEIYKYKIIPYPEGGTPGERIKAVSEILKTIQEGFNLFLLVDGPPEAKYHKVNPGVLYFSQKSGYPLIPAAVYMEKKITLFWRWDKFEIPLPFSQVVFAFGEPFEVPAGLEVADLQEKTQELEKVLDKAGESAKQALSGH